MHLLEKKVKFERNLWIERADLTKNAHMQKLFMVQLIIITAMSSQPLLYV